jgi:hypothetical protein
MARPPHKAHKFIDRSNEPLAGFRLPFREKIVQHVDDEQDWSLHGLEGNTWPVFRAGIAKNLR